MAVEAGDGGRAQELLPARRGADTTEQCCPLVGQLPALLTDLGGLPAVIWRHDVEGGVGQGRDGLRGKAQRASCVIL